MKEKIFTKKEYYRVHISRKMVLTHHDLHRNKHAMISIDHGFNWDYAGVLPGDFILSQNYVIREGDKLEPCMGYFVKKIKKTNPVTHCALPGCFLPKKEIKNMEMKLFRKEHYELMDQFEKQFKAEGRTDREAQKFWHMGVIYQNGRMNELFLAFRKGYALGKCTYQEYPNLFKK